jgi:hypothetical protein
MAKINVLGTEITYYQYEENDFISPEFEGIKSQAGLNRFVLSVKQWVEKTNSKGIIARAGRYGGTYAHKDIAFEFASWISPQFKLYLIKEFQRLKDEERKQLGWDIRRNLTKINYRIHTDAIQENLIPAELSKSQISKIYASEADILNMALLENLNALFINDGLPQDARLERLNKIAIQQMRILTTDSGMKRLEGN